MTRKPSSRKAAAAPIIPRDLLLAGIGAVSLGRKQAIRRYTGAVSSAYVLRHRAGALIQQLRNQAQSRLQPLLGKLGVVAKTKPVRSKRKSGAQARKAA